MSRWDIDPPGVAGVVERTAGRAQGFETARASIGAALGGAAGACGSEIVAAALSGFSGHIAPSVTAVVQQTGSILNGALAATRAYVDGDLEMAATAQANAATAPPGTVGGN